MASFLRRAKEVNLESDMEWEALEKTLPRLKGKH